MILCSHCMLLGDRNHLATKEKMHSSSKASQKARLRHPCLKPHLPLYRRLRHLLQLIVSPQLVQQARSHNPLPPAGIPHGGLVWCFLSAVLLLQRVDNGDAAHGQLFFLHIVLLCIINSNLSDFDSFMSRTHFNPSW